MSDLFNYDILNIHAPVFVGIVAVAVVGFVLMRLAGLRRESGMWIALAVLVLVLAWSNPRFINLSDPSNAADIIRLTSMLGIYSIGLAFVIALSNCLVELYSPRGTDDFTMATVNALICWGFGALVL